MIKFLSFLKQILLTVKRVFGTWIFEQNNSWPHKKIQNSNWGLLNKAIQRCLFLDLSDNCCLTGLLHFRSLRWLSGISFNTGLENLFACRTSSSRSFYWNCFQLNIPYGRIYLYTDLKYPVEKIGLGSFDYPKLAFSFQFG